MYISTKHHSQSVVFFSCCFKGKEPLYHHHLKIKRKETVEKNRIALGYSEYCNNDKAGKEQMLVKET